VATPEAVFPFEAPVITLVLAVLTLKEVIARGQLNLMQRLFLLLLPGFLLQPLGAFFTEI